MAQGDLVDQEESEEEKKFLLPVLNSYIECYTICKLSQSSLTQTKELNENCGISKDKLISKNTNALKIK